MVVVVDQHWPTKKTSYNCGISQGLCAWTLYRLLWPVVEQICPIYHQNDPHLDQCVWHVSHQWYQNRTDQMQISSYLAQHFQPALKSGSPVTQPLGPWVKGIRPVSSWIALPPPRNAPAGAWSACQCKGRYRRWYPGRFRAGLPTHMDTLLYHFHIFTCVMYIILINIYIYIQMCVCVQVSYNWIAIYMFIHINSYLYSILVLMNIDINTKYTSINVQCWNSNEIFV